MIFEAFFSAITLIFLMQYLGPFILYYKIGEKSFKIYFLSIVKIGEIKFTDIHEARIINIKTIFLIIFSLNDLMISYVNRPFGSCLFKPFGEYVLLQKKKGFFKRILISPEQPEQFLKLVQQKMEGDSTIELPERIV